MASDKLSIYERPKLCNPRLLLGFSGWMDGGEVSTGTVQCLIDILGAKRFAEIMSPGALAACAFFIVHGDPTGQIILAFIFGTPAIGAINAFLPASVADFFLYQKPISR